MNRDSGSEQPTQRTVAELLAEYGGDDSSQRSSRRRRRRAEDPSETAPQAIIERVLSDSGKMRAIQIPEDQEPQQRSPQPSPPPRPGNAASPPPAGAPAPPPPPPPKPPMPPAPKPAPPASNAAPPAEPEAPSPQEKAAGGFWSQRFSRGGATKPPPRPEQPVGRTPPPPADTETTAQQLPVPARPPAVPKPPDVPPPPPRMEQAPPVPDLRASVRHNEGLTEQFPRVDADESQYDDEGTVYVGAASLAPYADEPHEEPYADERDYHDEYDFDHFEDEPFEEEPLAEDDRPAGIGDDDFFAEEGDGDEPAKSPGKEWGVLVVQVGAGLLGGGLLWFGFRWLWMAMPLAALVAALVVTGALVLIARKFLRTDDLQTILLAVLVGVTCTVSPAALLLVGGH